jgi:dTMP kinase
VAILAERLRAGGYEVLATREPGATEVGAAIRALVLSTDLDARTETLLIAADRAEHVVRVIRPALARGGVVVSDRYIPSSLAYQGVGRGLGIDAVARISDWATQGLEPDVVIVVDVPPGVAAARRSGPQDRIEGQPESFRVNLRQAYLELAARAGWPVMDGTGERGEVAGQIWAAVAPHLERVGLPAASTAVDVASPTRPDEG